MIYFPKAMKKTFYKYKRDINKSNTVKKNNQKTKTDAKLPEKML